MRLFVVIGALLVSVSSAYGQSYGPPAYSVGETWKRNVAGKIMEVKVVKVEDNGTWFTGGRTDCPTCLSFVDKNLTLIKLADAEGKDVDPVRLRFVAIGWKFFDFPLEVNKVWRTSDQAYFRGVPYVYEVDWKVVSHEDVKTPAGTFKAFRVRGDWLYRDRMGGSYDQRWTSESWFAPEVKQVVKFTSGARGGESWELVSYELKR